MQQSRRRIKYFISTFAQVAFAIAVLSSGCNQKISGDVGAKAPGAVAPVYASSPVVQGAPLAESAPQTSAKHKGGVVANGKTYCEYTWEEKPGYADYTTIDLYEASAGKKTNVAVDRAQSETLQGSGKLSGGICANAKILKTCYDTATQADKAGNALALVSWASSKGYDLSLLKMAFAYQETHLGKIQDHCSRGSCNGIGIAQIITALKADGSEIKGTDPAWKGITYNVLTNLSYSSRVLQAKIKESGQGVDLITLARNYNGNPDLSVQLPYGPAVQGWYQQLKGCGL